MKFFDYASCRTAILRAIVDITGRGSALNATSFSEETRKKTGPEGGEAGITSLKTRRFGVLFKKKPGS